ncbi:ANTAR domain-containing protein [Parasulfuritortus cantonensis]|uniref:ANTAR domain-containing protein n=1 Tax=Parasulfuritortus cantonensis TaxID=2528202 RepID=A0A4R1B0R2_9PROT|nr:ANTAR domain-containing protein [Parasulfuritortus cantonensis]TCJ11554.1 ANTAR domain-containing protein [Parasulfuritortus cantonensis]
MPDALKILVISQSKRRLDDLLATLAHDLPQHHFVGRLDRAIDLPRWVEQLRPDTIIMDIDSPSRDTLEQVCAMSESTPRPIVMLSQDPSSEAMRSAISAGIAAYAVSGIEAQRLQPLLQLAQMRFEAWQAMHQDMLRARQELQEHKLIEKAKRHLMKTEKLGEEAAYQALRREAMAHRVRIADVARMLMATLAG